MTIIQNIKSFLWVSLLFISFSTMACNDKKNETAEKADTMKQDQKINTNQSTAKFDIYDISEVKPQGKGKAPDFTWTQDGQTKSFAELSKGKVAFVNFWGSWCPPCRREVPDIVKLKQQYPEDSLLIIGIAIERDQTNARNKVEEFGGSKDMNYTNFLFKPELIEAYGGINAVPSTFIIDKEGYIVETIVGARTYEQFNESLQRVLSKTAKRPVSLDIK